MKQYLNAARTPKNILEKKMNKLDIEEKEILAAYDRGKTASVTDVKKELARHRKVATSTFKKDVSHRAICEHYKSEPWPRASLIRHSSQVSCISTRKAARPSSQRTAADPLSFF